MQAVFKLAGLNKRSKKGVYATVEYGKEDWFHSGFDESVIPIDRQYALFDMFKNDATGMWGGKHKVTVEFDNYSMAGAPVNPIIKEIHLDL